MEMKSLGFVKKRRRSKTVEKTVEQREDELPWEIPIPFDATFLPTSLYKNGFVCSSSSSRFPSTNVQKLLEPYYDFSNTKPKSSSSFFYQPFESTRIEKSVCGSACVSSSPINRPHLAGSREASSSCPTISIPDGGSLSFAGKTELSSVGKPLPPIGVFWDIENCSVPRGRSALVAVQRIRERFFGGHLEAEFVCVCDIRKEAPTVIQELNDAQVSVVHVAGNSKNAADDKLRQSMRRFADISCSNPLNATLTHPATVVLISGDINFATDLSDLRYRKRLYVILLHNKQTPDALLLCAHEQYEFHSLLVDLPFRPGYKEYTENNMSIPMKGGLSRVDVLVTDLPLCNNVSVKNFVRNRLRKLSENCGGKVLSISGQLALIRFPNYEAALRASKRMNGEDVLGNKIRVIFHPQMEFGSTSYQAPLVREEFSQESRMQSAKSNQGIYSPTAWKPTWKRNIASEVFRQDHSRPRNKSSDLGKYNFASTAQSNSSSPNETSRDGSPNVMKNRNSPPTSMPALQLNNASQYQSSIIHSQAGSVAGSSFAFHQNLYPNLDYTTGNSNLRQESQAPQPPVTSVSAPRLYSTLTPGMGTIHHPVSSSNQHNLSMHVDTSFNEQNPSGGNAFIVSHSVLTPMSNSPVAPDYQSAGNCGNFPKQRANDGETFDLNVSNIDTSIGDWKAIRSALTAAFSEHINVRGIWVNVGTDGSASATVRLSNKEDAHYAVAQLHRRKIGNKRIFISFDQGQMVDHETLKKEVATLLQDVPNHTLPLFKFREMFEKRYKRSVSSSDLYRMKEVVMISESGGNASGASTPSSGRNISLTGDWANNKDGKGLDLYCKLHPPKAKECNEKLRMGWAEKEAEVMLPNVVIEIKVLATRIHSLLQSHDGGFPLISFLDCYEAEFEPLERASEGRGVPLEHLISCVQGVAIVFGENGMKRVQWHEKKEMDHSVNQSLATQLAQFGRELIDLLKTFPKCTLPFARLIPSYHAHFGRQCRVADYGHFSLSSLLQTLPHIIQIMGAAQNRVLTLSHRAQMKRFATDMLRVLKSQGGPKKQIRMEEFSAAFMNVFPQRQFYPEDYGLCYFSDLVAELIEHSTSVALIKDEDGNNMLAVPKREQTPQEIHRTRIFASEVVELLRHSTRCELEFSKFVPYYHHHFQKQCRVSDYGFSKLAELFDAISDTVVILSPSINDCTTEDKMIRLTPKEQIKVVGEQICKIIEKRKATGKKTFVQELVDCFSEEHGFFLRPELCGADSLDDLVYNKLEHFVKVENGEVIPVDRVQIDEISQKAETLLQTAPEYKMEVEEFLSCLNKKCENFTVDLGTIEKDLSHVVLVTSEENGERKVVLSPLRVFAYEITMLLESTGGSVQLANLENAYYEKFGQPLRPAQLGYPTILPMLQAIPDVLTLRGRGRSKKLIILNSAKATLESSISEDSSSSYGKQTPRTSMVDYWKGRDSRPGSGSGGKYGKYGGDFTPKRRVLPPPMFSPLTSPTFAGRNSEGNIFSFDRHPTPLSPTMYDVWVPESVAPGSPPMSPPVVWTCHPIFYPSSPPPGGPGNILMTAPFVGPTPWSPPPVSSNCIQGQTPQQTMLGNEFLFGQNRLTASFERLTVDTGNEA